MRQGKSPKFGKRHYIILALALKEAAPKEGQESDGNLQAAADRQWARTIHTLCEALEQDNPAFDADYFESTVSGLTKGTNCTRNT